MSQSTSETNWTIIEDSVPTVRPEEPEIEIVDETAQPSTVEPPKVESQPPSDPPGDDSDDDDSSEAASVSAPESPVRKKTTRSARLKAQRDEYARELAAERAARQALERRLQQIEQQQIEATKSGFDLYMQTLDKEVDALKAEYEKAWADADIQRLWSVQERIAEVKARKMQIAAEASRLAVNSQPAAVQPPPAPQPTAQPSTNINPLAARFVRENADWWGKDFELTMHARAIDLTMAHEGWDPSDPAYYDELNRRIRATFPHKFKENDSKQVRPPTVQNRTSTDAPSAPGKVRVAITEADIEMARRLGISIEAYARQKARRMAVGDNGYVEISV